MPRPTAFSDGLVADFYLSLRMPARGFPTQA